LKINLVLFCIATTGRAMTRFAKPRTAMINLFLALPCDAMPSPADSRLVMKNLFLALLCPVSSGRAWSSLAEPRKKPCQKSSADYKCLGCNNRIHAQKVALAL